MNTSLFFIIILSYLTGSISGGMIVGKIRNVDIRKKGSKATGATNAFRTMGALFALSVLIIDVYKGYFSVNYIPLLFLEHSDNTSKALAGCFSILGHVYPIFFRFKGGKGVGTALGTLLAFTQFHFSAGIGFITWLINLFITGYVGLGSILAGIMVSAVFIYENNFILNELTIYIIFISMFFILTHYENIQRLINGRENQFKKIMLINLFKKDD